MLNDITKRTISGTLYSGVGTFIRATRPEALENSSFITEEHLGVYQFRLHKMQFYFYTSVENYHY